MDKVETPEKIRAAAYYNPNTGYIAEAPTHLQASSEMAQRGEMFPPVGQSPVQEGFVTTTGRFVLNAEGEHIARASRQVPEGYEKTSEERVLGRVAAEHIDMISEGEVKNGEGKREESPADI